MGLQVLCQTFFKACVVVNQTLQLLREYSINNLPKVCAGLPLPPWPSQTFSGL